MLVANNNLIIYTNPNTDPYTSHHGGAMIDQSQTNLDAVIGSANYDLGHVFSTGGGGLGGAGRCVPSWVQGAWRDWVRCSNRGCVLD